MKVPFESCYEELIPVFVMQYYFEFKPNLCFVLPEDCYNVYLEIVRSGYLLFTSGR